MKLILLASLGTGLLCGGALAQGSDACGSAQAISGAGFFSFDNTTATQDGAPDVLCYKFGTSDIAADVWFVWTAPSNDDFFVSTCNVATNDTKIAIYDGPVCFSSPMIDCNDDAVSGMCGLQSEVFAFGVTAGSSYLVRIGSFPGGTQGVGQFEIDVFVPPPPPPPNDDCANAESISGCGSYLYDTTWATDDGLGDPLCYKFGTSQISHDVWFSWRAPSTGIYTLDTCIAGGIDTKLAVYEDLGVCPPSPALDCNDDTCGLLSTITWNASGGQSYLLRVGTFPSAPGAPGFFDLVGCPGSCEGEALGNYCNQSTLFTTGASTITSVDGLNPSLASGTLTLSANNLPTQPGIYIASPTQSAPFAGLPNIFNDLCLSTSGLLRLGSGADTPVGGVSTVTYNYSTMVFTANGQIPFPGMIGESWSFQRWNRDPTNPAIGCTGGPCVAGFSNAVTVCLAP